MGLDVAVGFLIAWAAGKVRRAGKLLDGVADEAVDKWAVRLRDVLLHKIGSDPAVKQLQLEAARPEGVSTRTTQRVTLALEDAIEQDADFRTELRSALADAAQNGLAVTSSGTVISGPITASGNGVAIGAVGRDANFGQVPDPQQPGRE